jgi:hypothetical protein
MRARSYEESLRVQAPIREGLIWMMTVVGKAPLQSTTQLWMMREPPSVSGKVITISHPVSDAYPLERQIGERRRRLADCEARMFTALEKDDIVADHCENSGEKRSSEPASDDGDLTRLLHAVHPWQVIRRCSRPVRLTT